MSYDFWVGTPTCLIIFGATGDLSRRKIYPALFDLFLRGHLIDKTRFICTGRSDYSNHSFRELILSSLHSQSSDSAQKINFLSRFEYIKGEIGQVVKLIREKITPQEQLIFYFAVKPSLFESIIEAISETGLITNGDRHSRFLFEKPFGHDYHSSAKLNNLIHRFVNEGSVYRIDHYLAKELIQNILVLRFSNEFLDSLLSKQFISNIQLTIAEDVGVEGRGDYFDQTGIVRDMFQNHILQTLSLILMEKPATITSHDVSYEKLKVLKQFKVWNHDLSEKTLVRAQYEAGYINGRRVVSYLEEKDVESNSETETFFAGIFECATPRWHNVPIFVRVGKRLPKRLGIISFFFKNSVGLSEEYNLLRAFYSPSALRVIFQPEERITMQLFLKAYGSEFREQPAQLSLNVPDYFNIAFSDAYSRILFDALRGDRLLFASSEEILQSWRIVDPILEVFKKNLIPLRRYSAGSWGPKESELLPTRFSTLWENL